MEAGVGVHDVRHLAHAEREGGVLERLLHLPASERPQVAAVACRGAVAELAGDLREALAALRVVADRRQLGVVA